MTAGLADGQAAAGAVRPGPAVLAQRDLLGEDAAGLVDLGHLDDDRAVVAHGRALRAIAAASSANVLKRSGGPWRHSGLPAPSSNPPSLLMTRRPCQSCQ